MVVPVAGHSHLRTGAATRMPSVPMAAVAFSSTPTQGKSDGRASFPLHRGHRPLSAPARDLPAAPARTGPRVKSGASRPQRILMHVRTRTSMQCNRPLVCDPSQHLQRPALHPPSVCPHLFPFLVFRFLSSLCMLYFPPTQSSSSLPLCASCTRPFPISILQRLSFPPRSPLGSHSFYDARSCVLSKPIHRLSSPVPTSFAESNIQLSYMQNRMSMHHSDPGVFFTPPSAAILPALAAGTDRQEAYAPEASRKGDSSAYSAALCTRALAWRSCIPNGKGRHASRHRRQLRIPLRVSTSAPVSESLRRNSRGPNVLTVETHAAQAGATKKA